MSRVRLKDSWIAHVDRETAEDLLEVFFKRNQMKVVDQQGNHWRVKQGSQLKTRLLGGWFVSAESLPKQATVALRTEEDGVLVKAMIEETMGFGFLDPLMEKKYEEFCDEWLDRLRRAIR
jgi:hypothetical protein